MRQIILLVLLFFVGQWLVKALRRPAARTSARPGDGARRQPGASGANGANGAANGSASGAGQSSSNRSAGGGARGPNGAARAQLPEPMIRCAECGVHAPKSDSVMAGGQPFCSHEHAQRFAARVAQTKGREGR
jgi:uncharacterized protein